MTLQQFNCDHEWHYAILLTSAIKECKNCHLKWDDRFTMVEEGGEVTPSVGKEVTPSGTSTPPSESSPGRDSALAPVDSQGRELEVIVYVTSMKPVAKCTDVNCPCHILVGGGHRFIDDSSAP